MINYFFRRYTLAKLCGVYLLFIFILLISDAIKDVTYPTLEGKKITVIGTVNSIEEKTNLYGENVLNIGLNSINPSGQYPQLKGVLVSVKNSNILPLMGETIEVSGTVQNFSVPRNPGEFNFLKYYSALGFNIRLNSASIIRRNCHTNAISSSLFFLRHHLSNTLNKVCSADSGMMRSILLGDKSALDTKDKQLFIDGGIGHILAISGLHISFLGIGLYKLLRKCAIPLPFRYFNAHRLIIKQFTIPTSICVTLSILIMILYGIMTGGSPSAIRAIVMFILSLIAELIGRTYDRITAIGIAAIILCIIEPRILLQSSFLMSFGAIIGITFIYPMLASLWDNMIFNIFAISLSVTLATLPIQLATYYQFPVYSFLLNIIVVPLMGLVMVSGLGAILLGEFYIGIGKLIFLPGHLCLALFQFLCQLQNTLPGHCIITGKPETWQIILYYFLLGFLLLLFRYEYHNHHSVYNIQGVITRPILLSISVVAVIIISRVWIFHSYMLICDVGQGDWIIFRDKYNHTVTIDGGSNSENQLYEYTYLPVLKSLGVKKINYMIFSHTDSDHTSASLQLLENSSSADITIDNVLLPPKWASYDSENYKKITGISLSNKISVTPIVQGDSLNLGSLSFKVLWPTKQNKVGNINGDCVVLRVDAVDKPTQKLSALLTGDLDGEAENLFIKKAQERFPELLDIDVLKVGHHGSKVSSSNKFLQQTTPALCIISVGKNNYGHPSQECLSRCLFQTSKVITTKENGAVKTSTVSPLAPVFVQ